MKLNKCTTIVIEKRPSIELSKGSAQNESKSLAHFTQSSCGLSTTEAYYRSLAPHSY